MASFRDTRTRADPDSSREIPGSSLRDAPE
jgi:hypothetical protein